jgi:hypothetical protein
VKMKLTGMHYVGVMQYDAVFGNLAVTHLVSTG